MGHNEALLFATAFLSAFFVYVAWKLDKERIYSVIVIFLILIATSGGKVVEFFGYETNAGNIFYASIFLATYFLIERYGKQEGIRSIWIGVGGIAFFAVMTQIAALITGSGSTSVFSEAFSLVYTQTTRVALASIVAFALSQTLNVMLYTRMRLRYGGRRLWMRANASNAVAQLLDSALFFSIAFWGLIPPANVAEVMLVGYVLKVAFMMVASFLLYLNTLEEDDDQREHSVTLRYSHGRGLFS